MAECLPSRCSTFWHRSAVPPPSALEWASAQWPHLAGSRRGKQAQRSSEAAGKRTSKTRHSWVCHPERSNRRERSRSRGVLRAFELAAETLSEVAAATESKGRSFHCTLSHSSRTSYSSPIAFSSFARADQNSATAEL